MDVNRCWGELISERGREPPVFTARKRRLQIAKCKLQFLICNLQSPFQSEDRGLTPPARRRTRAPRERRGRSVPPFGRLRGRGTGSRRRRAKYRTPPGPFRPPARKKPSTTRP